LYLTIHFLVEFYVLQAAEAEDGTTQVEAEQEDL
jgi:hypothetical protein